MERLSLRDARRLVVSLMSAFFLVSLSTGILKFPEFRRLFSGLELPMSTISLVHDWSGIGLVIMVAIHVLMHWGPVTRMFGGAR